MRVLVVDDEPDLCQLLQRYLRRQGFEAEIALTGEEALRIVEAKPGWFDTFLVDLTLPGMGGDELASRLLHTEPAARFVLTSGYVFDPARVDGGVGRVSFLRKPFMPNQLADALRTLVR